MLALGLAIGSLLALIVLVVFELHRRAHPVQRAKPERKPRRLPLIEEHIGGAIDETKQQFGEIFTSYRVWRDDRETRLELTTAAPWRRMSEFARALCVRHLWRALQSVSSGAVVVVDRPPQRWSREEDAVFRDRGVELWRTSVYAAGAPQYIK